MHSRHRTALIILCGWLIAACGTSTSTPMPTFPVYPTVSPMPTFRTYQSARDVLPRLAVAHTGPPLIQVWSHGGLCVYGECSAAMQVWQDGHVVSMGGFNTRTDVDLTATDLAALHAALAQLDLTALRSQPFTETCPTATDGSEAIFTIFTDTGPEELASCTVVIDPTTEPFSTTLALWQRMR